MFGLVFNDRYFCYNVVLGLLRRRFLRFLIIRIVLRRLCWFVVFDDFVYFVLDFILVKMGKLVIKRLVYEWVIMEFLRVENWIVFFFILKSRKMGIWMWMRFDVSGNFEMFDCDRNGFLKCVIVFVRDFCMLGFIFL